MTNATVRNLRDALSVVAAVITAALLVTLEASR